MSNPQLFFPSPLDQSVKVFVQLASSSLNIRIPSTVPLSDAFLQIFFHPQLNQMRRITAVTLIAQMVFMAADKNIPIVVGLNGGVMMRAVIDAVKDPQATPELQALSATAIGIIADKAPQVVCGTPNCVKTYVDLLGSEDKGTSSIGGGLYSAQTEAAVLLSHICSYGNGAGAKEIVKNGGTPIICKRAVDWKFAPATTNLFRGLRACVSSLLSLAKFGELPAVLKNGGLDTMSKIIAAHGPAANEALSFVLALTATQPQREVLMKAGVCDVLVENLAVYQDVNVQRKIVQIVGNLATDQDSMQIIAKTDVTSQIHDIMSSSKVDSPLWLQCIKCLLNLLVTEKTIKEFCDNDGIVTITEGLKDTRDPVAKQYLTYLVANILTVDDFVPTFVEEDGVKLVYPLLQDPSREIAVNAARAVSNLCTTLDEPRAAILESDGVKALSKALNRPELFVYALKISRSLALCTKKAECFKDEEFIKEVSKFLRASDTTLRGESVKVFLNLARTSEMRRYIFQQKALEPIVALAINDPEKDIRCDSLRVFVSMSSEGRVRKWANENGVVNSVKRMSDGGSLSPELKNQSQILLKNLSIAYEKSYSDGDCKSLDITAKYRSSQPSAPAKKPVQKSNIAGYKQQAVQGKTVLGKKQQVPVVVNKKVGTSQVVHKATPVVNKVTPQHPKTVPSPSTSPGTVQKKTVSQPLHKATTTSPSQVPKVQQKYFMPKTSTTPTYKTTPTTTVSKTQSPTPPKTTPSPTTSPTPTTPQKKTTPAPTTTTHSPASSPSSSSSSSADFSESSSSMGSINEYEVEGGSVASDSADYLSEDEDIPILSAAMQAELLAKQRAAVMQARIEEELARERAEKEARKREEEERRKAEAEAKERAAEEARKREAEARRKAEAEKLRKAAEEEKKRIEEESKRKIDQIMNELKHSKEEEIQEKIRRENEEREARKKEIEERKRLEEARQAEEEARRREEAEAAARKKRKAEERAARHERRRLEKERKAKEEAAAKRAEEEAKLKALEEEQRKAKEREEKEKLKAKEKEDARKKHIRRTYIVQEIFDTEKNYVEGLTFMINGYMQPLLEKCQSKRDMIIPQQQVKLIFSNVEIILNYASMLLELLQNRMESWSETSRIGDIFLSITPFFASYVDYVNNYPAALETLNKLHSNERFQAFLDRVEKERPDLYLPSVIAFPIQRIPRYILLLADLLKHTDKDHPDYGDLEKAVEAVREAGIHINERKRENENSTKMCQIQSSIKGKASQIFVPGRRFVSETNIGIVKKMGMAPRIGIGYLFSDSVFVARSLPKNKVLFKCLVPYSSLKTMVLEDSKNMTNGLKIINKSPSPKDKHSEWVITFDSKEDRKAWLEGVAENSKEFEERRKSVMIAKH